MKRAIVLFALLVCAQPARAHVGSPDVFFEGAAGPYKLFVAIRTPQVIPGIATIEIRTADTDIGSISVVPLRLTGPGSELPPAPDVAERSADDPQFFTATLWLMEHGSLQVRVAVDGARGAGKLAIPVPAVAQRTLAMDPVLGTLLVALMVVLALSIVSIVAAALREATLEPGTLASVRDRRRARIALALAGVGAIGVIAAGNAWWNAEAATYERFVAQPWTIAPHRDGCTLVLPKLDTDLLPDHGHDLHLFLVRQPGGDALAHLHPQRTPSGEYTQTLPSLPAGRYALFADIVIANGFPVTGTGSIDLPDLTCPALAGDDAMWTARAPSATRIVWDHGPLRANVAAPLRFHVEAMDGTPVALEPYMGMAGHAAVVRDDLSVFAHLHPAGSIAMPALGLAQQGLGITDPHAGHHMHGTLPPQVAFPYAFPQAGHYRVFVQVKRAGVIETGAFDADVSP